MRPSFVLGRYYRGTFFIMLSTHLSTETGCIRLSIFITILVAALGVIFGMISGSYAILFDGVYSLVDAAMTALTLLVVNMITIAARPQEPDNRLQQRFTMGLWHLEPVVIGLNSAMLMMVSIYALFNAILSLLNGGRELVVGWALLYAAFGLIACFTAAWLGRRANRTIQSQFLDMDVRAWFMSGCITAALLIAFLVAMAVQGTPYEYITPYIDPAVLALVCLFLIPMPIPAIRQAIYDLMMVTPTDLKAEVDTAAAAFIAKHDFLDWRAFVSRMGRSKQVELHIIVPVDAPLRSISEWDTLRDEIGAVIGDEGPDRWLTVVFTSDMAWAE